MKKIIGTFDSTKTINQNSLETSLNINNNVLFSSDIEIFESEESKIFFSGIIYNKAELEKQFEITTLTDSELVHSLFNNFNFNSIKQIDGKFTFIIINRFDTIICRDRHGCDLQIYYTENYFSNTLATIFDLTKTKKDINTDAIVSFLGLGYIPSPATPFKYIKKLGAGKFLYYKHGVSVIESNLFDFENFTKNKELLISNDITEINKDCKLLIKNAINSRILNKENINFIDFQNVFNENIENKNFTNKTSDYNKNNKIKHHEINILPQIIKSFEIPFNDFNIIHNYLFLEQLSKEKTDFLLFFNGINFLTGSNSRNLEKYIKLKKHNTLILAKFLKKILNTRFIEKYKKTYLLKTIINRVLNIYSIGRNGFTKKQIKQLLKSDINSNAYQYQNSLPINLNSFEEAYISHNYFIDIKQSLNEIELFQLSTISNKFNIQIDFPLLENNFYNFLKNLPIDIKNTINQNKNEKNKFTISSKINNYFHLHINQANYLYDANLRKKLYVYMLKADASNTLFNKVFLNNFLNNFEKEIIGKRRIYKVLYDMSFQFFNLLILILWWDIIINGKKGNTLQDFY